MMKTAGAKRIGRGAVALFFIGTALLFVAVQAVLFLSVPPGRERVQKVLDIPEGTTLRGAARLLFQNGLISGREPFVIFGRLLSIEHRIIPGEYALHTQMRPLDIIAMLKSGRVIQYEITIPEGYTMVQIGRLLDETRLGRSAEFIRRATDPEFIRSLGYDAGSLEGYLFPESYYFSKRLGVDGMLRMLVQGFESVYTPEMATRAREIGMTRREVVTLASIIEKETSVDSERPVVSAVFHNRIKRGIPLQSDPTVIYALPHFDGNLKRAHLRFRSPYNTYRVKGLPPGPIANPGKASLLAALYPAAVDYLYFVSKNDGTHYFSKTLAEHNRAVRKYQHRRAGKAA